MARCILRAVLVILFGIHCSYTYDCGSAMRTIKKARDIHSSFIHEYVRYVKCQRGHANAHWQGYIAECLGNTSCVGIVTTTPPVLCALFIDAQINNLQMEDLWLVIEEFERIEGTF